MTDTVDSATRSRNMSRIRSKNTKPELQVRSYLHRRGFRYRLHVKSLPGKPDLVLRRYNAAIFIHGCFWHRHAGCRLAYPPKSRTEFWQKKFTDNIKRDAEVLEQLADSGWRVLIIWECSLRASDRDQHMNNVVHWLRSESHFLEIGEKTSLTCQN